ncbi:FG-GAP-like repeat-containing protein [bacterium]|nr:FG-GAP-like repeat-containing protein [bacterium]
MLTLFSLWASTSARAQSFNLQTHQVGLQNAYYGNGVAAADYNNDGFIDIYLVSSAPNHLSSPGSANSLFKNNGDGTFTNVAKEANVEGVIDTTTIPQNKLVENFGASWGDYDNDGDVDLYLTNKGVDELYENLGDGTFRNITHSAGLDLLIRDSASAVWFDLDNDGYLDLYVSSYGQHGLPASSDNVMYRNNGDGTFTNITAMTGLAESGFTFVSMVLDANKDGAPDLYCVNDFGDNFFYLNKGDGTFREATREFGLEDDGHGMGVTLGDFDNDGLFDIYLTNIADDLEHEWSPLFRQTGSGYFQDVTLQTGTGITYWAWGCEFFDFDLDGDLDLYVVNGTFGNDFRNLLFRNNNNGTFEDFSQQSGADGQAEARGLCVADFDNDGRLDMFVANIRATAHLYLNSMQDGNYLKINLIGTQSNRDARGAVVRIAAAGKTYHRPNDGIEFYGQSKAPIHFGLGEAELVQNIKVEWPSGIQQEFHDIPANQTITINENSGIVTEVTVENSTPPGDFALLNNYPNPLRDRTLIYFRTGGSAHVKIEVYDILGRLVAIPVQGPYTAGDHTVSWEGTDRNGHSLPSGIYIQKLSSGNLTSYRKLTILR